MLKFAERVLYHILKSWVGNKSDVKFSGSVLYQILKCGVGSKSKVTISLWGINQMLEFEGEE